MNTLIVISALVVLVALFLVGRWLYLGSVRLRNRLLMERVFTNISHELLTPLTVLSASVERMRSEEPRFAKDYALMSLNIDRMVRLLQEILETSKSHAGELKLLVSQADVMQYISQTALCLEPLIAHRGLKLSIHCTPRSMMGWIDTDKLDKIIYNLISNAAKYTNAPGEVCLDVTTNDTYDHVVIKVHDTGIGISPEKMKHLFQRFYDGKYRAMQVNGTGLGLALTRDLVSLHGGTIRCESQEGVGTTFTVTLPINKGAFAPSQRDEQHRVDFTAPQSAIVDLQSLLPQEEPPQPVQPIDMADDESYRILVVEDNVELLMLMRTMLCQKYVVFTAYNGREALDVIATQDLDLVISDVMMPEMDGNELTRRVKGDPNTSHLPVILLTAKTLEEDRRQSPLIGADDYITKPFRMGDLQLRIDNIIENRKRVLAEYKAQTVEETRQKTIETPTPTADDEFLHRAIDCVYDHLDDADFDRDAFAQAMGASASTLYNKLRSITGLNVSAFIRDMRMKEAKRLAQTQPDLRVSDLAYKVGFKDPKYFSTCFKKEFGIQPSEYLDQMQNANR